MVSVAATCQSAQERWEKNSEKHSILEPRKKKNIIGVESCLCTSVALKQWTKVINLIFTMSDSMTREN